MFFLLLCRMGLPLGQAQAQLFHYFKLGTISPSYNSTLSTWVAAWVILGEPGWRTWGSVTSSLLEMKAFCWANNFTKHYTAAPSGL